MTKHIQQEEDRAEDESTDQEENDSDYSEEEGQSEGGVAMRTSKVTIREGDQTLLPIKVSQNRYMVNWKFFNRI